MKFKSQDNNIKHIINEELASIVRIKRLLSKEILNDALNYATSQEERLDVYLVKNGLITEEVASNIIAKYLGFEYTNIDVIKYSDELVSLLTLEFIEKNKFIVLLYEVKESRYTIALADPFDAESIRKVYALFGVNARIIIAPISKIKKIASRVHSKLSQDEAITEYDKEISVTDNYAPDGSFEGADLYDSPAVKLVESTLKGAIAVDASDIHIEPYEDIVRIRYRIDGKLLESTSFNTKMFPAVSTRIKILAGLDIAEKRLPQDGRISMNVNNIDYDFRVSTLPTINGEKIVIRILDQNAFEFKLENLGFIDSELPTIRNFIKRPHGIILLTGPTGCGKSTTLYSFIKEINDESVNIITVEDPVEYSIEGVNQVQINPKANLTFASALRSILRQDPNVIMIGEIRDEETAEIAMRMAITGHLVLSTLHTNDACGAVNRLVDLGLEPFFVADALTGVISQRLVRRLCPECKKKYTSSPEETKFLKLKKERLIYKPIGCPACHNTGYKGRIGVHEVLNITDDIKELILNKAPSSKIKEVAIKNGMNTLFDTTRVAVLNGDTSIDELLALVLGND